DGSFGAEPATLGDHFGFDLNPLPSLWSIHIEQGFDQGELRFRRAVGRMRIGIRGERQACRLEELHGRKAVLPAATEAECFDRSNFQTDGCERRLNTLQWKGGPEIVREAILITPLGAGLGEYRSP